eukprot:506147_1
MYYLIFVYLTTFLITESVSYVSWENNYENAVNYNLFPYGSYTWSSCDEGYVIAGFWPRSHLLSDVDGLKCVRPPTPYIIDTVCQDITWTNGPYGSDNICPYGYFVNGLYSYRLYGRRYNDFDLNIKKIRCCKYDEDIILVSSTRSGPRWLPWSGAGYWINVNYTDFIAGFHYPFYNYYDAPPMPYTYKLSLLPFSNQINQTMTYEFPVTISITACDHWHYSSLSNSMEMRIIATNGSSPYFKVNKYSTLPINGGTLKFK